MRTEIGIAIAVLTGIIFKLLHLPMRGPILVMSLMLLAIIYFAFSYYIFRVSKLKEQNTYLSIIGGLSLAIIPIGILFKLMYWPSADKLLLAGLITSTLLLIVILYLKSRQVSGLNSYYRNMLIRTTILWLLSLSLYLTPMKTLLEIQHWDNPELARLKYNAYSNPDNEEYQQKLDNYYQHK